MVPALLPIIVLLTVVVTLLIFGLIEFQNHQRVLNAIPLRIHINGTRGKSSVTRLVAAGLRAGGLRTFAKTTGTAPRVIDVEGKDHIIHRLRKPSIGEQVRLLRFFARERPDAVVMECMAVQPQYQWISEHQMVKAHIGVITNVRPDHLDEMGPTTADIAMSLSNTIPKNGILITAESEYLPQLTQVSKLRNSDCISSAENSVTRADLHRFAYLEHPQNVSLALEVCRSAGVDRKTALAGMVTVQPDLGALVVWRLKFDRSSISFINSMAANDPVSTMNIWEFVIDRYPVEGDVCVFLNTREDRPYRTKQLLQLTMEYIKPDYFVVRGNKISTQIKHLRHYSPGTVVNIVSPDAPHEQVLEVFKTLKNDSLIYAIGNQVGAGQEIIDKIRKYRRNI
ncbi:MAG: poly-gamma-glutamate synthase PgsB [Candidatus Marinimicrobia bacterium]|nr:poly-gamma-glutamate synthase PgsB [Candidatus Neomarinimicrobiota bacterium]